LQRLDESQKQPQASVSERYLVGMLSPRRNPVGGELLEVSGRDSHANGKADIPSLNLGFAKRVNADLLHC
jgi:hypothetical protein